jgi:methylthioribose-1-phosphate isomerase
LGLEFEGQRVTPVGATARNPAFDVTPHRYLAGIITENGIARPPYTDSLARAVRGESV